MNYLQKIGNNTPIKEEKKELGLKMQQKTVRKKLKKESGITLIALVVTIVVLLILAGITINYIFSEGGLFDTAKNSGNTWQDAQNSDINAIKDVNGMIGNLVNGTGNGGTTTPTEPDDPTPPTPPEEPATLVSELEISSVRARIATGYTKWITVAVKPENATDKTVEWSSSDTDVATVDSNGIITANKKGTTTVTVTTKDGSNISKQCKVTVDDAVNVTDLTSLQTTNTVARDNNGNLITVPKGFKVLTSEATDVTQGIVIEDEASTAEATGNQFVWIPVDAVSSGTSKPAYDVRLGRYIFDETTGAPIPVQLAFNEDGTPNYENTDGTVGVIKSYISELSISREGSASAAYGLNATAKDLETFLIKTTDNGGYYIARYEASYGGGYNPDGSYDGIKYKDAKPLSKKSIANTDTSDMKYNEGTLWNRITQLNASRVSRNMYNNESTVGVESDLMNSYAFDTAIVYIRQMKEEYANFANFKYNTPYGTDKNVGSKMNLDNTGANNNDKFCNIYDMVANCNEWTTEYSTVKPDIDVYPCVYIGGKYYGDINGYQYDFVSNRRVEYAINDSTSISFRPICYIK